MHESIKRMATAFMKERSKRRRAYALFTALALVVSLTTTYLLVQPASAMEGESTCTMEEHTHSEACYEVQITCGYEESEGEEGHSHAEAGCATEKQNVCICGEEECEAHTHEEACYRYTCGKAETEGHTHSEACYSDVQVQTCTNDAEDHEHSAECYVTEQKLSCGKDESEAHAHEDSCIGLTCGKAITDGHAHNEACYEEQEIYTCGLEEKEAVPAHTHTEECYGLVAVCGMEEHVHVEECYPEPEMMILLPEGAEIPEGYDITYSFSDVDNGFGVAVYAPEGALPEGAELMAQMLEETSEEYVAAEEALTEEYYDGMVAMDIRFELNGEEVEPSEAVFVCINAIGLLPEDADPETVSVKHHTEVEPETFAEAVTNLFAGSEIMVETVADNTEDTGVVEVTENSDEAAADFSSAFEVESFSTFTVTWKKSGVTATLTIHYVDENGKEIDASLVDKTLFNPARAENDRVLMDDYSKDFIGRGYYYLGAYTKATGGSQIGYVTYLFSGDNQGFRYSNTSGGSWNFLGIGGKAGVKGATKADVYLRYKYMIEENGDPTEVQVTYKDLGTDGGQMVETGGTNTSKESDKVSVSKTMAATDIENVFDITLTAETSTKLSTISKVQPLDVVIVMDVSNTMSYVFGGMDPADTDPTMTNNRYAAAMTAAENFINQFQDSSNGLSGNRRIGLVTFNTSATTVFGLSQCKTDAQAANLISTMKTKTKAVLTASGYASSHGRFTNMQTGLYEARQMLASSNADNKYIIFLTDGLPTTYGLNKDGGGYCPYYNCTACSGTYRTSKFTDKTNGGLKCTYGTSYSDSAAHYAETQASAAKKEGIKLFTIGVDIGGQKIPNYEPASGAAFSVIQSVGAGHDWLHGKKYVIGYNGADDFKNWLQTYISSGEGYYFSTDNKDQLQIAFDYIFEFVEEQTKHAVESTWAVEDPVTSSSASGDVDYIEFIDLYNKSGALAGNTLSGSNGSGKENTVKWDSKTDTINWDLKKSGYTTKTVDGKTIYTYTLKYRVRLENERAGFVDSKAYNTNGTTTLVYREVADNVLGDLKLIKFPIPKAKGYLDTLSFTKKSEATDTALAGAEFTLTHKSDCGICHGDGTAVPLSTYTATSDSKGVVSFANIPSGHDYILKETFAPAGHHLNEDEYSVIIRYIADRTDTKVTVIDPDGVEIADLSKMVIYNESSPVLPNTGGIGTGVYVVVGTTLMIGASLVLMEQERRRRRSFVE